MEKELRQAVKNAARAYFQAVHAQPKDLTYIPASGKCLDEEDLEMLMDACLDMWLTAGRFNDKFEEDLAAYLGVPFAATTNSGSSANLLANARPAAAHRPRAARDRRRLLGGYALGRA